MTLDFVCLVFLEGLRQQELQQELEREANVKPDRKTKLQEGPR